jgi:hypothetical protein
MRLCSWLFLSGVTAFVEYKASGASDFDDGDHFLGNEATWAPPH